MRISKNEEIRATSLTASEKFFQFVFTGGGSDALFPTTFWLWGRRKRKREKETMSCFNVLPLWLQSNLAPIFVTRQMDKIGTNIAITYMYK